MAAAPPPLQAYALSMSVFQGCALIAPAIHLVTDPDGGPPVPPTASLRADIDDLVRRRFGPSIDVDIAPMAGSGSGETRHRLGTDGPLLLRRARARPPLPPCRVVEIYPLLQANCAAALRCCRPARQGP